VERVARDMILRVLTMSGMEGDERGVGVECGVPVEGSDEEGWVNREGGGRRDRFRGRPRLGDR
jgi:hypothetical protein